MEIFERISCGINDRTNMAYLDFAIATASQRIVAASFYNRSLEEVRAIGASFASPSAFQFTFRGKTRSSQYIKAADDSFTVHVAGVDTEDGAIERVFHGIAVSNAVGRRFFFATEEQEEEEFYQFLMKNYDFPLLESWKDELFSWAKKSGKLICHHPSATIAADEQGAGRRIPINGKDVLLESVGLYECMIPPNELKAGLSLLLKQKRIWISRQEQEPLDFTDMDSYFNKYGKDIVENLSKQLRPYSNGDGIITDHTLKQKALKESQARCQQGAVAALYGTGCRKERRKNASNYIILNEGMGSGKTLQAMSICEALKVKPLLASGYSLKDVYSHPEIVNYRNIVMCPSHLVEKWATEIRAEVPYAKPIILRRFEQLLKLWKHGPTRNGREYYIISKDFAKLSYQERPAPVVEAKRLFKERICIGCGKTVTGRKCSCGRSDWKLRPKGEELYGMLCPRCGNVLLPANEKVMLNEAGTYNTLTAKDFAAHKDRNDSCLYCGEVLWQPHVRNLGGLGNSKIGQPWLKATHYVNKAHKAKKTVWVHRDYMEAYFDSVGERPLEIAEDDGGARKYDPATFIKKHMKNFFDVAIFDEVHTLKGGNTAQGHAMHAIVKASKKQIALTGTIAGGYADHLFYVLYRLDPKRMKGKGYGWSSVGKFTETYGSLKTRYEALADVQRNTCSRGKQVSPPKCMPGISPRIYTDFLLDKTLNLDITDMSASLPPLKEIVRAVPIGGKEKEMYLDYRRVVDYLNKLSTKGYGMTVLSTMLQFSLSYLDKPYGVSPIRDPLYEGNILVTIPNHSRFGEKDFLSAKEEEFIGIVKSELSEGRNCFVFAEYTNSPETCITGRLRDLLQSHLGLGDSEIQVLNAGSIKAEKREEWIHQKAKDGMKVCIVNPRCIETGLDLIFTQDGTTYNYPTLIFYQLGYSLFTIWQASRRHYRLSQTEECRTYYMAWEGTVQQAIISLIAEKMAATSAIQGKFSAEGLTAMAHGVDVRVRLAQTLARKEEVAGSRLLQDRFDSINAINEADCAVPYVPMKLLAEILGEDKAASGQDAEEAAGNMAELLLGTLSEEKTPMEGNMIAFLLGEALSGIIHSKSEPTIPMLPVAITKKKVKKPLSSGGQVSLYDL